MLRSLVMGLVAGQRGMTPLASVAAGTYRGALPSALPLQRLMLHPLTAFGAAGMAALEMAGDKMKSAPDRIVPVGLAVRGVTSAYAGAAVAPAGRRAAGATLATAAALASSYVGWRLRCAAMARYGQTRTGFVEDALVLAAGLAVALQYRSPYPDGEAPAPRSSTPRSRRRERRRQRRHARRG